MTKKLKILGPYTPEHPGPFCTRRGKPVDLKIRDGRGNLPLIGYVGGEEAMTYWPKNGRYDDTGMSDTEFDLMNAEEVPVAREFWVNISSDGIYGVFEDKGNAILSSDYRTNHIRTIHVREVLPGDGE